MAAIGDGAELAQGTAKMRFDHRLDSIVASNGERKLSSVIPSGVLALHCDIVNLPFPFQTQIEASGSRTASIRRD